MRILHISDLHTPAVIVEGQKRLVAALLADVTSLDRERRIDIVIFSGDLTHDGSAEAFASARQLLLDPLSQVLPGRRVILTPGNHDVDRREINEFIESGLQQRLTDGERLAGLLKDSDTFDQARRRLCGWDAFDSAFYEAGDREAVGPLAQVHRLELDGCGVGVAVLNSAWRASGGEGNRGRLILGAQNTRDAIAAIDQDELRLVVMHHPLSWVAEFDALSNRGLLESHGVFVFTGHEHTPDPASEITTRGAALYSRAGCLYAGSDYSNSYTVLDLDPRARDVTITLRRWWPQREEFDQATDLHREGRFQPPWPARANALPTQNTSITEVLAPLAEIAQEQSLIASDLTLGASATVSDLLVDPQFWPVPNKEAIDAAVPQERRPKPVGALDALTQTRVLIVSGEHSSGVTSSLLWMLEKHFRLYGTALPAYVSSDERFSLGRLNQALSGVQATSESKNGESIQLVLAVDDVDLTDRRAQARLVRFIEDHPNVTLVLGCHEDQHAVIGKALDAPGIPFEEVFLAPFGRREMRQLISRIAGPNSTELVKRVLNVIHGQGLARNPLNVAALVAVVTREEDLTELNESGLLQSYVTILLENPVAVDPEGLAMDYRRREHFLSQFAQHLVNINRTRLSRRECEQFVLDYYERLGWVSESAGQLLDSLIRRRVLSQHEAGVGFRYAALLHLFAAKAATEDEVFASTLLADPVRYASIIRHVAGLRRSDAGLLKAVGEKAVALMRAAAPGVDVEQFELMQDQGGWSRIDDLDEVRQLVRPAPPPPTEEELDELYEDIAEEPSQVEGAEAFPPSTDATGMEQLGPPVGLLASVLKSSELVADIKLKTEMLREVVSGWGLLSILVAIREDETGELRAVLERLFSDEADEEKRQSAAEHFSRVLVITFMNYGLFAEVGSRHLRGVIDALLDDEEFLAEAANDLFATMLYAMLDLPGWPDRIAKLHDRHGKHPMIREVARRWALRRYVEGDLAGRIQDRLEAVLVEMLMPEDAPPAGPARAAQGSKIRERLLQSRRKARWLQSGDRDEPEDQEA